MKVLSIEIKSKVSDPDRIHKLLTAKEARFVGEDHQTDTYFNVPEGRLKLRQGNIENTLIQYNRPESKELKSSEVVLQKLNADNEGLLEILKNTLGVKTIVDKQRSIYFIGNVKFHIDEVASLGSFMEIEALDVDNDKSREELSEQCDYYIDYLGLDRNNFIDRSYSDMIMQLDSK